MHKLSSDLEFEEAAKVRDEIKRLEILDLQLHEGNEFKEKDSSDKEVKIKVEKKS